MKKLFLISGIMMILIACSSERMNFSQLQERSGMYYLVNSDKPFSGDVSSYVNGKVEFEGKIDKGLKEGPWTYYHPNGQKKMLGNFKEGQKDGTWTYWKDNGTQEGTEMFKYGKSVSSEGTVPQEPNQDTVKQITAAPAPAPVAAPVRSTAPAPAPKKVEKQQQQQPVAWEKLHGGPVKFLDGVPYTGPVIKYQKNGEVEFDGYLTNGKKTGKWNYYDKKGNLKNSKYY
jgi:antitoxin component YwqK of YwqJK toxin-antitoxin module